MDTPEIRIRDFKRYLFYGGVFSIAVALLEELPDIRTILPILSTALTLVLFSTHSAGAAEYHTDPERGDDRGDGSAPRPWRTLRHSVGRLKPGDRLLLHGGVFAESGVPVAVAGASGAPIHILNAPGESPFIDGGFPDFRSPGNTDWEAADPRIHLYRSEKTYANPTLVHGYFEWAGRRYKVVPYERLGPIRTVNQFYSEEDEIYVGPGACWNPEDRRIYVRIQQTDLSIENGYSIADLPTDPRMVALFLFPDHQALRIEPSAAHLVFEGLDIRYQNHAVEILSGANHITFRNCNVLGGRTHILAREGTHHLVFDGLTIHDAVPDWIAWTDVKSGVKPAHSFQNAAFNFRSHHVEVKNCEFTNLWDGFNGYAHDIRIVHNEFREIRDDCFQFWTTSYNVEIGHNRMIRVSKGPGYQGTADSEKPGTKYVHHNIIDCTKLWQYTRKRADGTWGKKQSKTVNGRGQGWAKPFGAHGNRDILDPWKVYHNTVIFGDNISGKGAGHEYTHPPYDPKIPQEVYNNIFIQTQDSWLADRVRVHDGSQIHDGNLYFRSTPAAEHPLFNDWQGEKGGHDFQSLEAYRSSPLFVESQTRYPPGLENSGIEADPGLDKDYRPDPDGPAASGAVPLPPEWPGPTKARHRGALPPE